MADVVAANPVEVSVLVPVYNNAATLDELLDRLLAVLEPLAIVFEIICVDDGSQDASLAILKRRAATDARIRVFALVRNFGSQAASCAACDQVRGRRIVHIDADLENFPEDIPMLLERLSRGYDLVCGYREHPGGRSLTRRLSSFLINIYVRRQTGTDLRDVGCGLRALDGNLIRDLAAAGEARRLMTPVLLRRAQRMTQLPVRYRPTGSRGGPSFRWLLGIAIDYYMITAWRPFLVGELLFAALLSIGMAMLAFGPRLSGLIVAATGALGALLSLLGEHVQRMYHLAQGMPFYTLRDLNRAEHRAEPSTARIPPPVT